MGSIRWVNYAFLTFAISDFQGTKNEKLAADVS
jgi:hypothetical protein